MAEDFDGVSFWQTRDLGEQLRHVTDASAGRTTQIPPLQALIYIERLGRKAMEIRGEIPRGDSIYNHPSTQAT